MIKLLHKYKNILTILVFLLIGFKCYLLLSPTFKIVNKTDSNIMYSNVQIQNDHDDPTLEEIESYGVYYIIDRNKSDNARLFLGNFFNPKITISFNYFYQNTTEANLNTLKNTFFQQTPVKPNDKAYCSFNIEVYPNKKTVVTPIQRWGCIRPMYYNESPLLNGYK